MRSLASPAELGIKVFAQRTADPIAGQLQCCDWHTKHASVLQSSFWTHVPSFPGEYSHDWPTFAHAPDGVGAGALLSSGGQPRSARAALRRAARVSVPLGFIVAAYFAAAIRVAMSRASP